MEDPMLALEESDPDKMYPLHEEFVEGEYDGMNFRILRAIPGGTLLIETDRHPYNNPDARACYWVRLNFEKIIDTIKQLEDARTETK